MDILSQIFDLCAQFVAGNITGIIAGFCFASWLNKKSTNNANGGMQGGGMPGGMNRGGMPGGGMNGMNGMNNMNRRGPGGF